MSNKFLENSYIWTVSHARSKQNHEQRSKKVASSPQYTLPPAIKSASCTHITLATKQIQNDNLYKRNWNLKCAGCLSGTSNTSFLISQYSLDDHFRKLTAWHQKHRLPQRQKQHWLIGEADGWRLYRRRLSLLRKRYGNVGHKIANCRKYHIQTAFTTELCAPHSEVKLSMLCLSGELLECIVTILRNRIARDIQTHEG